MKCAQVVKLRGCGCGIMKDVSEIMKPHEKLLGITRVSNPATRKDLAARTWGVFWY